MFNKVIGLRLYRIVQKIDDIHISLNNVLHIPQKLSIEDMAAYMGLEKALQVNVSGIDLILRRLDKDHDKHFIDKWKKDLDDDPAWYLQWVNKYDSRIGTLPRTYAIPTYSYGIISSQDNRENLEGIIAFFPTILGNDVYLSLSELELYYQNVGRGKVLSGLGDMFMDLAVKLAVELTDEVVGIDITPVTPGSIKQVEKRGYEESVGRYFLSPEKVYEYYHLNELDLLLESEGVSEAEQKYEMVVTK